MNGKTNKFLVLIMVVILSFTVFIVGCSNNENNVEESNNNTTNENMNEQENNNNNEEQSNDSDNQNTQNDSDNQNTQNDSENDNANDSELDWSEKETIKYFSDRFIPEQKGLIAEKLEEKYNFEFDIMGVPGNEVESKLNILLASGDLPDFYTVYNMSDIKKNGLASFTMEELETYMPRTVEFINNFGESNNYDMDKIWQRYYVDGNLNQIPKVWTNGANPQPVRWREDVLEELRMEAPNTLDEVTAVFAAYKEKYPNKFPYSSCAKNMNKVFSLALNSTGYNFWDWVLRDGKIVHGSVQPEMKEVLAVLVDWNERGFINPNWITNTNNQRKLDFINDNSIVLEWVAPGVQSGNRPPWPNSVEDKTQQTNPEAEFIFTPWPSIEEGVKAVAPNWDPFHGGSFGFGKHLEDDHEKINKIMVWQDEVCFELETMLLNNYGIEGETWHWVEEGDTKFPEFLPEYSSAQKQLEINTRHFAYEFWNALLRQRGFTNTKYRSEAREEIYEMYREENKVEPGRVKTNLYDEDGEDLQKIYGSNLDKKREQYLVDIVNGNKPVDAFDEWIEYWENNGGPELTEAANRLNLKYWE